MWGQTSRWWWAMWRPVDKAGGRSWWEAWWGAMVLVGPVGCRAKARGWPLLRYAAMWRAMRWGGVWWVMVEVVVGMMWRCRAMWVVTVWVAVREAWWGAMWGMVMWWPMWSTQWSMW